MRLDREMQAALQAYMAEDVTLGNMLKAQSAGRFSLYQLMVPEERAALSLMPKPVDASGADILFWLWYWSFAFSDPWAQYTPHSDWRRLCLEPDCLTFIREMFAEFLEGGSFRRLDPDTAQDCLLNRVETMRSVRRGLWPWRKRFQVFDCRRQVLSSAFDDTPLRTPFVEAWQLTEGFAEFETSDRRVILFETETGYGLWDWRSTPRVDVA